MASSDVYEALASDYDAWAATAIDDVRFYVEQALEAGGPIVELGVGTGRIAIPTAMAGVDVIGIDASPAMIEICARRAAEEDVADRLDLRVGTFEEPPVPERVRLVTCPFRSYLHLSSDGDRKRSLAAVSRTLVPGGRFVFDVFAPWPEDAENHPKGWVERAAGVTERTTFDWDRRIVRVEVRSSGGESVLQFAWLDRDEWRALMEACGFRVRACYGWFDLRPCSESVAQSIWVAERV